MYPPREKLKEYVETVHKPFVLCEYCHAMGNSPGDLALYWDIINKDDRMMGGFIWEWADHGISTDSGYLYGGDFGDDPNGGNYCIDGIVSPNRAIKSGTLEMKKIYQPIIITRSEGVTLTSRNFFADITADVDINGRVTRVTLKPRESITLPASGDVINVKVTRDGNIIAWEGFYKKAPQPTPLTRCKPDYSDRGRYIDIIAGENRYILDKVSGMLSAPQYLKSPLTLGIYRAPTDNDKNIRILWQNQRMNKAHNMARSIDIDGDSIKVCGILGTRMFVPIVRYTLTYTFFTEGVKIDIDYQKTSQYEWLPRIGFSAVLDGKYSDAEYLGYGPQESYIDKKNAAVKGTYRTTPQFNFNNYIKPQENGSHHGCEYAQITDGVHTVRAEGDFSFCISPYSLDTLITTAHNFELVEDGNTYLYLDYYMSGIGSNSCGPQLADEFKTPDEGKGSLTILFK